MKKLFVYCLILGSSFANASVSKADTIGLEGDSFSSSYTWTDDNYTLGWAFSTTSQISLTALGYFDRGENGLVVSHDVGVWNSAGALVASATVAAGTSNALDGHFRYASIAPVTLAAGHYRIGGVNIGDSSGNGDWYGYDPTNVAYGPEITFQGYRYTPTYSSTTLTDPTSEEGGPGGLIAFFGGNFKYTTSEVPAPSSVVALIGMGLMGLVAARKRRDSQTEDASDTQFPSRA